MALWSLNTNEVAACLSKEGLAQMYNIFWFYYSLTVSPKDHLLSKNLLCCDEYLIESGATVFRCQALGTSSVSAVSTLPSQEIWEWNGIINILRQNFILTVKIAVAVGLVDASPGHCVAPGGAEADVEEVGANTLTPLKGLALIIPRARGSLQHKKWTKFV